MSLHQDTLQELFVVGARNLHAVEKQALSIMTPQVARIEHYPEVADQLRRHIDETEEQVHRLDEILAGLNTGGSALKDAGLSLSGSTAAIVHSVAGDEILKLPRDSRAAQGRRERQARVGAIRGEGALR